MSNNKDLVITAPNGSKTLTIDGSSNSTVVINGNEVQIPRETHQTPERTATVTAPIQGGTYNNVTIDCDVNIGGGSGPLIEGATMINATFDGIICVGGNKKKSR